MLTCSHAGGPVEITLDTPANTYNVASDADVDAVFALADATITDKVLQPSAGYAIKALQFMGIESQIALHQEHLMDNALSSGWSMYADIYHHQGVTRTIFGQRRTPGFFIQFNNGVLRLSNFAAFTNGTTTYPTGRLRVVMTWDGTTLKGWVKPVGGITTEEINAAVSFSSTQNASTSWGGLPNQKFVTVQPLRGLIYDAALWMRK